MNKFRRDFREGFLRYLGLGILAYDGDVVAQGLSLGAANVVTSERTDNPGTHALFLDIDIPHFYAESSTPGHGHLMLDVSLTPGECFRVMRALARAGVIGRGYLDHSRRRGFATLRLPWNKKKRWEPAS